MPGRAASDEPFAPEEEAMIEQTDVDVPVRTAYNQWTQFEDFPLFMDHVESVRQVTDDTVRWRVKIAGVTREWDAKITEQTPDQRIAWTAIDGTDNAGVVTFHALDDLHTRIVLQLDMDPHGLLEQIADKGGFVRDRAKKDLADFKAFIERRGRETGAYRGAIDREQAAREATATGADERATQPYPSDEHASIPPEEREVIDLRAGQRPREETDSSVEASRGERF
jgi:uncharacterized membrane protein